MSVAVSTDIMVGAALRGERVLIGGVAVGYIAFGTRQERDGRVRKTYAPNGHGPSAVLNRKAAIRTVVRLWADRAVKEMGR